MANDLFADVADALDLPGRMERHPYQTMLVAAGIGFVASGALFSRFTMRVAGMGIRVAALPILEERLQAVARATVHRADRATP